MIAALALALLQTAQPRVGDTVWIEHPVATIRGAVIRPQSWPLGDLGQQLGPPQVRVGVTGTMVRYALVLWYPGDHLLKMPGPVVIYADGRSDTLAVSTVRVQVASVLPGGSEQSRIPPKPATSALPLEARTVRPLLVLELLVALGLGLAALAWRRRGKLKGKAGQVAPAAEPPPAVLRQWAEAGEYRAALHEWAWVLARRLKRSQDLAETAKLQKLLEEIAFTSFSPLPSERLAALCERAAQLAGA